MITLKQLTDELSSALNAQGNPGVTFVLHNDTGEYTKAVRDYNDVKDVINGIVTLTSSEVENTNDGLTIASLTTRTELLVPCRDTEEDIEETVLNSDGTYGTEVARTGNVKFLASVRDWIDEFCAKNGRKNITDADGVSYDVSFVYSLVASGVRQMDSLAGDYFTFTIYTDYSVIQGGVNSRSIRLTLDGEKISYSSITPRRVPTQEANVYAKGEAIGKSLTSDTVFGLSVILPATGRNMTGKVFDYILNGNRNEAHFLTVNTPHVNKNYLVQFGQTDATASGVLNVGLTTSFVECVPDYELLKFPDSFFLYEATAGSTSTLMFDGSNTLYRFGEDNGFASGVNSIANYTIVKGDIIVSLKAITNASSIALMPLNNIAIPKGTYLLRETPIWGSVKIDQALTGVTGSILTANNTYSDNVAMTNIQIVPNGELIYIATGLSNVLNDYEDQWYTDNNGNAYSATDTTKLRTWNIAADMPCSLDFYKWAIVNGNLIKQ